MELNLHLENVRDRSARIVVGPVIHIILLYFCTDEVPTKLERATKTFQKSRGRLQPPVCDGYSSRLTLQSTSKYSSVTIS